MKKLMILMAAVTIGCCLFSCKKGKDSDGEKTTVDSLAYFTEQIKAHPKDAVWYYKRAKFQFEHNFVQEAYGDILKCVKLDNAKADYYVLFADIDYARQDFDGSEEHLQKALQLEPKNNEVRLKLAELFYYRARAIPALYDEALKLLEEARTQQPHNPKAYLIEAMCYKEKGDTTQYLHRLQMVIDQDPQEVKAHLELGYFYQKHLDPLGIDHYQNALHVDPANAEINYNLGLFYRDLGRSEEAKEQFQHLVSILHSGEYVANAYYQLGYFAMQEADYKEAVAMFTKAIETDPQFVDAYAARGETYENLAQFDQARADYNRALQLVDNFEPAIQGLNSIDKKLKAGK
ncbi:MAG: tetratricopeptide repeat protein [Bacteroidales bacterium]|nr:tetratricopeptide repeat protein [Bacteroidales bacterium]